MIEKIENAIEEIVSRQNELYQYVEDFKEQMRLEDFIVLSLRRGQVHLDRMDDLRKISDDIKFVEEEREGLYPYEAYAYLNNIRFYVILTRDEYEDL